MGNGALYRFILYDDHFLLSMLRVLTGGSGTECVAGAVQGTPAKVLLEEKCVGSVHIPVAFKITITGVCAVAGVLHAAPPEIRLEGLGIGAVHIAVCIKISLTVADIQ